MAIGLGLMFGLRLPVNFDSPFKAHNVIDYWSRWHMTLTRFLTAYIYNPIVMRVTRARLAAGKPLPKRGKMSAGTFFALVAYPTVLTMFISGIWHGAGWQFVVFGLLHGFYLAAAHGWRAWKVRRGWKLDSDRLIHHVPAVGLTFLCGVIAMVFFRADSVIAALAMLRGMLGLSELAVRPDKWVLLGIAILLGFCWLAPNIQQWMRGMQTALDARPRDNLLLRWVPVAGFTASPVIGLAIGAMGFFALAIAFSVAPTEFLYFQF